MACGDRVRVSGLGQDNKLGQHGALWFYSVSASIGHRRGQVAFEGRGHQNVNVLRISFA